MRSSVTWALTLAVVFVDCSGPDHKGEPDPPPTSMHILADGTLEVARPEPNTLTVSYHANLLNGGTEACHAIGFRRRWPEELAELAVSETTYGGGSGPKMQLGDRSRPEGVAVFDISGVKPTDIDRLLAAVTMEATCDDPEHVGPPDYVLCHQPAAVVKHEEMRLEGAPSAIKPGHDQTVTARAHTGSFIPGGGGIGASLLDEAEAQAQRQMQETHAHAMLQGVRGNAASDIGAIARLLVSAGQLLAQVPEIQELDFNPVLAGADGCAVVDARVILAKA